MESLRFLESEEGMKAIVGLHVDGIVAYVDGKVEDKLFSEQLGM